MLAEIATGLSSLKAAYDITKGLNAAVTQASIDEVKIELQPLILDAQQALFTAQTNEAALTKRIGELEQEIVRLKDWSAERERYEAVDIYRGSIAYMEKVGVENSQTPHWLCANCFQHERKSPLQFKGGMDFDTGGRGGEVSYGCDHCNATLKISDRVTPKSAHEKRLKGD